MITSSFNPIQDGVFFGAPHEWRGRGNKKALPPEICQAYPTMMKLGKVIPYLKKIQKIYVNHVTEPLNSSDISFFYRKSATFALARNTDIDRILLHNI